MRELARRLQLIKIAVIRAGIRVPADPDADMRWLHDNGYLEPFEDVNGTDCYRASDKALRALRDGFPSAIADHGIG